MTGHYAKIHDTTIREAFDRYQAQRVNISGQPVSYDPDAPTASAEWVKHNLNRVRDSLPNGYCARPAQQDCPHPNACLTCPDFQTTPVFLEIHQRQAVTNRHLTKQADANGQQRLAGNLRRVQANLDRIIPALQELEKDGPGDDPRSLLIFLTQANARRHQAALLAAHHAIEQLQRQGQAVSFNAVAQSACVSRGWLYRQDQIRDLINRQRALEPPAARATAERATADSLRQRLEASRA